MCEFYLGTHRPHWLRLVSRPLFVSRRTLSRVKEPPRATCTWALDSGGFSELSLFGAWQTPAEQYAAEVVRWKDSIGRLSFAAIQDWMCEPFITAKTGLSVSEHQRRTVASLLRLRELAPSVPWLPVIQGYSLSSYFECVRCYERVGVDLATFPRVGVGSICRRQSGEEAAEILRELSACKFNLHGFGLKLSGLRLSAAVLKSADSMAWSFNARRESPLPECTHKSCANCLTYALKWARKVDSILSSESKQTWMKFEVSA